MKKILKTQSEIKCWLNAMDIKFYELVPNEKYGYVVDVKSNVDLIGKNLNFIPVKFNKIKGHFSCSSNALKNLKGCPKRVGGNFDCSNNLLDSLIGCPQSVGGNFYCNRNQLTSLLGCPEESAKISLKGFKNYKDFICDHNQLTSLEGGPESVGTDFYCYANYLTSIKHGPQKVGNNFNCSDNCLTSLEGCPKSIHKNFFCHHNSLKNLLFFPQSVEGFVICENNPLLGPTQNIVDFKELYQIHRVHQEKLALSHMMELPEMSKTTYKI